MYWHWFSDQSFSYEHRRFLIYIMWDISDWNLPAPYSPFPSWILITNLIISGTDANVGTPSTSSDHLHPLSWTSEMKIPPHPDIPEPGNPQDVSMSGEPELAIHFPFVICETSLNFDPISRQTAPCEFKSRFSPLLGRWPYASLFFLIMKVEAPDKMMTLLLITRFVQSGH